MNFKKKKKEKKSISACSSCVWPKLETANSSERQFIFWDAHLHCLRVFFSFIFFFFYPRLLSIAIQHFRAVPNGFARLLQETRKASADNNYIVIECIIIVNVFKLYSKWIVRVNLSRRNRFIFNGIEGGKATCYVNRIKLKSLSCCKNNENLLCGYEEVFR